jgi:hypothetical protein
MILIDHWNVQIELLKIEANFGENSCNAVSDL